MNISKKLISLLLAAVLLLTLCSCDLVGDEPRPGAASDADGDSDTQNSGTPDNDSGQSSNASSGDIYVPESPDTSETPDTSGTGEEPPIETTPAVEATPPAITNDPNAVTPPPAIETSAFQLSGSALLSETADMGMEYVDKMVFLGDSTTYGMKYYAVLTDGKDTKQVWTPSNGTLTLSYQGFASIVYPEDDSEIPIRDAVSKALPEYLVITLGVNGISFMEEDYFKSEYTDLVTDIQDLSPNTKIILQSIFPVASNYEYLSSINNDKIAAANGWILEVAENTGTAFLNTASVLVGADGWLPQEYQNGDGIHLNETGFGIVLAYIRTHGYQ